MIKFTILKSLDLICLGYDIEDENIILSVCMAEDFCFLSDFAVVFFFFFQHPNYFFYLQGLVVQVCGSCGTEGLWLNSSSAYGGTTSKPI